MSVLTRPSLVQSSRGSDSTGLADGQLQGIESRAAQSADGDEFSVGGSARLGLSRAGLAGLAILVTWAVLAGLDSRVRALAPLVGVGLGLIALVLAELWRHERRDHTRSRSQLARLAVEARRDDLTGLANRAAIMADVEHRLTERDDGEIVGLLFCDLDRLKVVNDSLGHEAGDQVLAVAARRLSRVVREVDLLGRFGGDEFVVVSSEVPTARDLAILAERLIDALRKPVVLTDGSAQVVSGSVGIAYLHGDQTGTAGELVRDAEVAMYRAKRNGGDRHVVFDASHRAEVVARLAMEQELRQAIRDGDIDVHYQPIVDGESLLADRFEALIRWEHRERGTVRPSEFLPIAAESQLIVELGELVLERACRRAAEWTEVSGRPITVAVNVAERQLLGVGLVETVTRVLARTGLAASQLELEITEELILERLDHSLVVLRQLDLVGVRLAIDDFGTSQASLGRLKQLAMVSTLKIDRLFVDDIANDDVDRKIVTAIVAMASSVGLSVVAEGVETEAQAEVLRELGVDSLQGFLYGRPVPASVIGQQLAEADGGADGGDTVDPDTVDP